MNKEAFRFRVLLAVLAGLFLASLAFSSGFVVAAIQPARSLQITAPHSASLNTGSLDLFREAWDLIDRDFFGPLPSSRERAYGGVRGLLDTLGDPYTVFVEPIPRQLEQDDLRGSYGGVGVNISRDAKGRVVLSPFRDSPAAAAGILEGDVLIAIDNLSITPDMDVYQDIEARIRGEVGTSVHLVILREKETLSFTVIRQLIEVPSAGWRMLEQAPTLGYIQITSFTDRTAKELKTALDELFSNGAQGLVLDLRDNGGGLLQSAIDVADQFLDGGVVLYERQKGQDDKPYSANEGGHALEIPLVILINHGTASASEIVAGAIQDRGRGALIGEPTFGKGSVQLIFDLSDGSSLHVTAARWYTPNRHQLDGVGLTPDLLVEVSTDGGADVQLKGAIEFLQKDG